MGAHYRNPQNTTMQYMEHGLKDIAFYVQKHITPRAVCYNFPLARDKLLGVPALLRLVYYLDWKGHLMGPYCLYSAQAITTVGFLATMGPDFSNIYRENREMLWVKMISEIMTWIRDYWIIIGQGLHSIWKTSKHNILWKIMEHWKNGKSHGNAMEL